MYVETEEQRTFGCFIKLYEIDNQRWSSDTSLQLIIKSRSDARAGRLGECTWKYFRVFCEDNFDEKFEAEKDI